MCDSNFEASRHTLHFEGVAREIADSNFWASLVAVAFDSNFEVSRPQAHRLGEAGPKTAKGSAVEASLLPAAWHAGRGRLPAPHPASETLRLRLPRTLHMRRQGVCGSGCGAIHLAPVVVQAGHQEANGSNRLARSWQMPKRGEPALEACGSDFVASRLDAASVAFVGHTAPLTAPPHCLLDARLRRLQSLVDGRHLDRLVGMRSRAP